MDAFYVLVTKVSKADQVTVQKLSWDKKEFVNMPDNLQSMKHHPLLGKLPKYREFLSKLQSSSKGFLESEGFRNLRIETMKKGVRTEEANEYLNDDNKFEFKGTPLTAEPVKQFDPNNASFQSPTSYSGLQLMQLFSEYHKSRKKNFLINRFDLFF